MRILPQRLLDNLSFVLQPRRKPLLLGRILRSYTRHLFGRKLEGRPIRNIDVALNYACNMGCEHCSCEQLKSKAPVMDVGDYRKLVDEADSLGVFYFSLTGGEPVLNRDLEDIIQAFKPSRHLIGLQTNAFLIDRPRAKSLYQAGLDVIQVSLDSMQPESHDAFRKVPGALEQTLENVQGAREEGIKVIFCTTVFRGFMKSEDFRSVLGYCKDHRAPLVVSIACPVGNWTGNFDGLLSDEDREDFRSLQKEFPGLRRDFDSNYTRKGCSCATEKLYITPYGDVIPCPFIHISFGNVREEPLPKIRRRMLRVDRFREYNSVCLAGEDHNFIDRYIVPTYNAAQLPQPWHQHPVTREQCAKTDRPDPGETQCM
jgi:MoaA/NifB/PqqE/SkfB family radical SAM enzyme